MGVPGLRTLRRLRRQRVAGGCSVDGQDGADEVIITDGEVHHHWADYAVPNALGAAVAGAPVGWPSTPRPTFAWAFLLLAFGLALHAGLKALAASSWTSS